MYCQIAISEIKASEIPKLKTIILICLLVFIELTNTKYSKTGSTMYAFHKPSACRVSGDMITAIVPAKRNSKTGQRQGNHKRASHRPDPDLSDNVFINQTEKTISIIISKTVEGRNAILNRIK
jgi:hypothetical protein